LLHVLRKKLDYPELRRTVKQHAEFYGAKNILIEDKASGTQLIQDLQADGVHGTTRYEPKNNMDKTMRMHAVSSTIENGFVHIPTQADWLPQYLHEMTVFPNGKFDDQVDSTSQALDWVKDGRHVYGLNEYYRMAAAKLGFPCPPREVAAETTRRSQGSDQAVPSVTFNPSTSGPCSKCGATCVGVCSGQLRCNQCGFTWWPSGKAPEVLRVSRADVLSGRFGRQLRS
jgi:predicted phage terminase large subunit-like protein